MSETCKTCKEQFDSGVWKAPQFNNEKVLLFCTEKCRNKYLNMKLERIKVEYPGYYQKLLKKKKSFFDEVLKNG
ncbi:MAG: hypothetical protein ABIH82_06490 [Candidatus Woesearchaeota archaeon]